MKKFLITLTAVVFSFATNAQSNVNEKIQQGTILYEQVVKLEINLDGESAQFANMLPKERRSQKRLYFSPEETLYENFKATNSEENMDTEEGPIMIKMMEPDNKLYTNITEGLQVEQR